jgi:hypothetical protein
MVDNSILKSSMDAWPITFCGTKNAKLELSWSDSGRDGTFAKERTNLVDTTA